MATDIATLIRHGETSKVQFKLMFTSQKEIAQEMAAFANGEGGVILFGVEDKTGNVFGLSYEEIQKTSRELGNAANEQVKPTIYINTDVADIDGKMILVCKVNEGKSKPYKDIGGTIWVKQGADKRRVTENSEILGLFQDTGSYNADLASIPGTSIKDLDSLALDHYFDNVYHKSINDFDLETDKLLTALRITDEEGRLTVAGLLYFGHRPQLLMPNFVIKAVWFVGNDIAGTEYRDSRDIEGTIPEMFDEGMRWLKSCLRKPQNGKSFNSTGDLEIPEPVLEELLQNALVHLDLLKPAAIRLLVFDDRVEIINPGCLPGNQTVEEVKLGNSHPRNIQLANFCARTMPYRGLGSGIPRAYSLDNNIELVNSQEGNQFKAIIKRITNASETSDKGQNVPNKEQNVPQNDNNVPNETDNVPNNEHDVPQNDKNVPDGGINVPNEVLHIINNVPEKGEIIKRWIFILKIIGENASINTEDIAKQLNVSSKTVKRDIQAMNDYIQIHWTSARRYGRWEIRTK